MTEKMSAGISHPVTSWWSTLTGCRVILTTQKAKGTRLLRFQIACPTAQNGTIPTSLDLVNNSYWWHFIVVVWYPFLHICHSRVAKKNSIFSFYSVSIDIGHWMDRYITSSLMCLDCDKTTKVWNATRHFNVHRNLRCTNLVLVTHSTIRHWWSEWNSLTGTGRKCFISLTVRCKK